jgi:two-component system, NarL family, response regulator LiaR
MMTASSIRVLLVDDHTVVRSGLGAVLEASDDMTLAGEAGDGEQAVRLCEQIQPDVVLMDILMPKMDGLAATAAIHRLWPQIRIIALTSYKEKEYIEGILKAGAMSYLLKNVSADELITAIHRAMDGKPSLSPEAAQVLIQKVNQPPDPACEMTRREQEILELLADGLSNSEIALHLAVSQSTVKYHVSHILSKLGVTNRTEAVTLALKQHLVK